jgi:hypothetical protein
LPRLPAPIQCLNPLLRQLSVKATPMKSYCSFQWGLLGALLAGTAMTAGAADARYAPQASIRGVANAADNASITNVGPVTGTITALNYDTDGTTVNGLYLGDSETLLTFDRPVCGGIGSLGKVGDPVTYSGIEVSFSSGSNTVIVKSYRNGSTTYAQNGSWSQKPAPTAYPPAAGLVTALNYNPVDGSINGFFFTPTGSGSAVFVDLGLVDSTLAGLLEGAAPVAVSVTGLQLPPRTCTQSAASGVVVASSLTIGGTAYLVGGLPSYAGSGR